MTEEQALRVLVVGKASEMVVALYDRCAHVERELEQLSSDIGKIVTGFLCGRGIDLNEWEISLERTEQGVICVLTPKESHDSQRDL